MTSYSVREERGFQNVKEKPFGGHARTLGVAVGWCQVTRVWNRVQQLELELLSPVKPWNSLDRSPRGAMN